MKKTTELIENSTTKNRFNVFHLFLNYYAQKIPAEEWVAVRDYLEQFLDTETEKYASGLGMLTNLSKEDIELVELEFTRLFIGPNKLPAPPYESVYCGEERMLMTEDTMIVRNFYAEAGLEVKEFNIEVDDHIEFELEFICYLLHKSINDPNADERTKAEELYQLFFSTRFAKWVPLHCDDVIKSSKSKLCTGIAIILKEFVINERKNY